MKRKLAFMVMVILSVSVFTYGQSFRMKFNASYFHPQEEIFREIYGGGISYGGEIDIKILKSTYLWFGADYFSKTGNLTLTREDTEITIVPIIAGLKFILRGRKTKVYLGFGLGSFQYKEINPIGEVKESSLGYTGQLGILFKVGGSLIFDVFGNYSYCRVMPQDIQVNIGGIRGGLGIGFEF